MEDGKIKIGDIEGNKDAVLDFIKSSGADLPSMLNASKDVKVPFRCILVSSIVFIVLVCIIAVAELCESVFKVLSILCIADAFVLVALVYMAYKNGILTSIIALGETLILAISLGLYTPKDVVKKIEDVVNEKLEIGENNK